LTNSQNLPKGLRNGYTRISNEILEALMYADLTKREYKICLCILRYGYGYNQDKSEIRCHQSAIAQLTGLYKGDIAYSLRSLENKNIIKWNKVSKTLTFNRHVDTWKVSKTLTPEIKKVSKILTKKLVKHLHKSKQNTNIELSNSAPDKAQRDSKDILKTYKEKNIIAKNMPKPVDNSVDNLRNKGGSNKKNKKTGNDTYPSFSTPAYSQEKFTRGDWELLRQAKMDLEMLADEERIYKWLCRLPPGLHNHIALHLRRIYPKDNSGYDRAKRRYEEMYKWT